METIDALAEAINDFDGGMMIVSHDFRLISQVWWHSKSIEYNYVQEMLILLHISDYISH